jgi:glycosyltransferase involved in cell wall biosynthesis
VRPFKLLILTPTALPAVTGNAMTAERWRRSLVGMGLDVRVFATEGCGAGDLARDIARFRPDVVHVHNAYRAGGLLPQTALKKTWESLPLVVSPSGTDMNIESRRHAGREIVRTVLDRADAIIVQSEEGRARLREVVPECMARVFFAPKSFVWLGEEAQDLRAACGFGADCVLFFMPAGIRPVKGNLECLLGFETVHGLRPRARIVFSGPPLDGKYEARFRKETERLRGIACWIPPITPAAMRSAYESADVILNGSFSEGLSNVLIEGKAAGRPLLASDIPGNRWPVLGDAGDAPMGLLFDPSSQADFTEKALRLIDGETLRRTLGEAGAAYARRMPGPCDEARALVAVYEKAMGRVTEERVSGFGHRVKIESPLFPLWKRGNKGDFLS